MEASSTEGSTETTDSSESTSDAAESRENGEATDTSSETEQSDKSEASEKSEQSQKSEKADKSTKSEKSGESKGGYLQPRKLTVGEIAGCVAALAFVGSLFLPWYGTSSTNPNSSLGLVGGASASNGDTATAWETFPILRYILLAAAIAPFILAWIVMRQHKLEWKPGEITMIVGIAAFVLVLCNGVILGRPGDSVEISLQWGYPIALLACAGMAVSGFLRQSRHADAAKPPGVM